MPGKFMKKIRNPLRNSIPVKICLSILLIETMLLTLMGVFYTRNFNNEIEISLREKLQLPAVLMSLRALSFSAVNNLEALSDLIQADVLDAYIFRADGTIFYSIDAGREGNYYREYLHEQEKKLPDLVLEKTNYINYQSAGGDHFISSLSPLTVNEQFLGNLYMKILANQAEEKKQDILLLFVSGGILTILATTVLEAFYLYGLFVPRIQQATKVLHKVEQGDFSAHVINPGKPDQLGRLIEQINGMIKTVFHHTDTLTKLNRVGEELALVHNYTQLFTKTSKLLIDHFNVEQKELEVVVAADTGTRRTEKQELEMLILGNDRKRILLRLPADVEKANFYQSSFENPRRGIIDEMEEATFQQSLNRMLANSVQRIQAIELTRLAESKYRKLFDSTIDGILRTTPEGTIEEANPACARMFGFDSPADLIKNIYDIRQQFYAVPENRDVLLQLMAKEGSVTDFEVMLKRRDGSPLHASMTARALRNGNGEIVAMEGRITDIEERKLREKAERERQIAEAAQQVQTVLAEELQEKRRQLQQSLDEKEILLREVLHRTKNNMMVIISMLRLQLHTVDDEKAQRIFRDTENRIRAMALVHEKLYKSRNLAAINLGEYLSEMVATLINAIVLDQRINLETDVQPVALSIDHAVPLGLAVNEIITNAVKHGFPGNKHGTISLKLRQHEEKLIELIIRDNGVGLPHSFKPDHLESFGMMMTHNLITRQLQGSYTMHSEGGTVATIRFEEPQHLQRV